jgi:Zn-dependent protease
MDSFDLARTLKFLPGIIFGLTIHEFSHAWIAKLCGDHTSSDQGRVTMNPLKHIDPIGFIMLLVAGFGWAKPVQFNEQNLRNPKTDVLKIAVAGPLSNAILAILLSMIFAVLLRINPDIYYSVATEVFIYAIYINWGLFIFNLIPLPPLDGSHLVFHYFKKYPAVYEGLFKYGSFLLFGLILATIITKINFLPIWPVIEFLGKGFLSILGVSI